MRALALVLLLAPLAAGAAGAGEPLATMRDDGDAYRFDPLRVEAAPGALVRVVNAGATVHTLTSSDGTAFDTGRVEPGAEATFPAPPQAGEHRFYCRYHAAPDSRPQEAMAGVLVVAGSLPPPTVHGDRLPMPPPALLLIVLALGALVLRPRG